MPDQSLLRSLVETPTESLTIELKTWLNLNTNHARAKLVTAVLAIYNRGGGNIVIGINDKTRQPDPCTIGDIEEVYRIDTLQGLVSKYSSQSVEISVDFIGHVSMTFPVITIPGGVRTPVAIKSDLVDREDGKVTKHHLRMHDVVYRTLNANGTFSSSVARAEDWEDIIQTCFDNREADIGRFVRRHLTAQNIAEIAAAIKGNQAEFFVPRSQALLVAVQDMMDRGRRRMKARLRERELDAEEQPMANWGYFEISAVVTGIKEKHHLDHHFYNALMAAAPRNMDWPTWVDTMAAADTRIRPVPSEGGWELLIVFQGEWAWDHYDFIRSEPEGRFYFRRAFDDDASARKRGAPTKAILDPGIVVTRLGDAIATLLAFAKALGAENGQIGIEIVWHGLRGRYLSPWASQLVIFPDAHQATDDDARNYAEISTDTAPSTISEIVEELVRPVMSVFNGFSMPSKTIESRVNAILKK